MELNSIKQNIGKKIYLNPIDDILINHDLKYIYINKIQLIIFGLTKDRLVILIDDKNQKYFIKSRNIN